MFWLGYFLTMGGGIIWMIENSYWHLPLGAGAVLILLTIVETIWDPRR